MKICKELGITDFPKVIRAGMTEQEKRTHARKLNMARRQLSNSQKEALTKAQIMETPEKSDRQIARELGVSNPTVSKYRKELEASGDVLKFNTSTDSKGREQPRDRKPIPKPEPEPEPQRKPVSVFNPTAQEESGKWWCPKWAQPFNPTA